MTAAVNTSFAANVARRLHETALAMPLADAVVEPQNAGPRFRYRRHSFRQLDDDSTDLARGLVRFGVLPGTRLALFVRPGFDFISLVFAVFKAGAVAVLIDPGQGRRAVLRCLDEARPQGFIAVPVVHALRMLHRRRYPEAKFNVVVGRRWPLGPPSLDDLRRAGRSAGDALRLPAASPDDPAAIIFTTGSTGPAKGVLYRHRNFDRQIEELAGHYGIRSGEIDLSCFPLFALFNAGLGVTTVIPRMDFSRPATVDPSHIAGLAGDLLATTAFASPAVWDRVGRYCQERKLRLPSLKRVLSAGAPVHADVLARMKDAIHPEGDVFTPYGASEALPVASIAASEVLRETAAKTRAGAGVCVGRRFPGIAWKVIRIVDGPLPTLDRAEELPPGQIGELLVSGDVVTREYFNRPQANALAKIDDGGRVWHRMGDVGHLDEQERFWFCGRMSHRVVTAEGTLFTIPCEAIVNEHEAVSRSAVVGIGPPGRQTPVVIIEPHAASFPKTTAARQKLLDEVRELAEASPLTRTVRHFLIHPAFPVDVRHNAKIFREKLALWAATRIPRGN
ncbi:MAG: AMP-binding protein [Planctomycetia bacterium]|nr:AMP-binding protein [Planctomycetia bacterium]